MAAMVVSSRSAKAVVVAAGRRTPWINPRIVFLVDSPVAGSPFPAHVGRPIAVQHAKVMSCAPHFVRSAAHHVGTRMAWRILLDRVYHAESLLYAVGTEQNSVFIAL